MREGSPVSSPLLHCTQSRGRASHYIPDTNLCNSQRVHDVSLRTGQSAPPFQNTEKKQTHNRCLGSRDPTPGFQPSPREPVYPKQRRIAQGSYVRAVSSKLVPVQGIFHKDVLEKRNHFVVHALGALHRGGGWFKGSRVVVLLC
jgi:hypothetical protein